MSIELKCGSTWKVCGSDNYDRLVGANPIGVVFSEYSLAKPAAWEYIRPILTENGGWALFIFTPRGENHAYALYTMAEGSPDWFAQTLTVDQTKVIGPAAIQAERDQGVEEAHIQQEYYGSFDSPLAGAYYGPWMRQAKKEGRICELPHRPDLPVVTWWDLGGGDATAN